jgi:hypothetical protein
MHSDPPRSVKISDDERRGWTSDRPRRPGEAERPPREPDVGVRGRVLSPTDRLRYSPGSLVIVACADHATGDRFCARVVRDPSALLSLRKVRGLIAGRVAEEELEQKAQALLDAAVAKRMSAGLTVVITADGLDAAERLRYVRLAAANRRPRHLILVDVANDAMSDADRAGVAALRTQIDAGGMGAEGFVTSLRLGGRAIDELNRIVFAPPPKDD